MPTSMTTPRLPIDSCEKLLDKLKWDYEQLQNDSGSSYLAFNFVVTAHHLYVDWLRESAQIDQKNRKGHLPANGVLLFRAIRDITNATKHWKLDDESKRKQVVTKVTPPYIGDLYSYFIAGPVHYIHIKEYRPSLPELAYATVKCLEWIIEGDSTIKRIDLEEILKQTLKPLPKAQQH